MDFPKPRRSPAALFLWGLVFLLFCGCSLIPSGWRFGGSALDKNERAQEKQGKAQAAAIAGAQAAVHKAELAIVGAPQGDRAVELTRDFVSDARALLDQAHGAPSAADDAAWRELVVGLLSDNAAVRSAAEKQRSLDAVATANLARDLARATAVADRANERALGYARESEGLADFARKLKLGFFSIIGLLVLGTVLSLASRFFPALGGASRLVNGVLAPGITYVAHRAQLGLAKVGEGMAQLREITPIAEDLIERAFDGPVDSDHKKLIAAGAAAAGSAA